MERGLARRYNSRDCRITCFAWKKAAGASTLLLDVGPPFVPGAELFVRSAKGKWIRKPNERAKCEFRWAICWIKWDLFWNISCLWLHQPHQWIFSIRCYQPNNEADTRIHLIAFALHCTAHTCSKHTCNLYTTNIYLILRWGKIIDRWCWAFPKNVNMQFFSFVVIYFLFSTNSFSPILTHTHSLFLFS